MPPTNEELQVLIQGLTQQIIALHEKDLIRLKSEYDRLYGMIRGAISSSIEIENMVENTSINIQISNMMNQIAMLNNPYNDGIGFNFIDVINKKVEETLVKGILPKEGKDVEKVKGRFLSVIQKVINNPIADVILHSNPVGTIVSNVINTASNFIHSTAENFKKTDFGGIKSFVVDVNDEIKADKIAEFRNSIQKYVNLYGAMLSVSENFKIRIQLLQANSQGFVNKYTNFSKKYFDTLGLKNNDPYDEIDLLFIKGQNNKDGVFYESILNNEKIRNGIKFIANIEISKRESQNFKDDFDKALDEFFKKYIEVLNIPILENWSETEINKTKLKETIGVLQNNQSILKNSLIQENSDHKIALVEIAMGASYA